jgi:DnaJ-class molecular chaperone
MTEICNKCNGDGMIEREIIRRQSFTRDIGLIDVNQETCPKCQGDGVIEEDENE